MQRVIRVLRIALPIAFVAFIVILALSWNRSRTGTARAGAVAVTSTQRPSDEPQAESTTFEDTQTIGGRVVSRVRAERVVAFKSGWNTLEGVNITIYRLTGQTYELFCPEAQVNSETKEAEAKGGVKVTSSDGLEVITAQIHFDGTRLTNRIPVQFKVDRWQGNAGALDMNVEAETVRLFQNVTAAMIPASPAETPMTINAADGIFRRKESEASFTENVVMTRAADRLECDRLLGRFTQDRKSLIGLEGNGHVTIGMAQGTLPGEDLGGRKTITCERFFTEVAPDGTINAINTIGQPGRAHAVLDGPPRRDILADTFRIALTRRAVSEIRAETNVVMKEMAEVTRQINSDRVIVSFDPARHRASGADFDGHFKYADPKTTATAVRANYDIANDRVLLTAIPGFDPTVISDGQTLKAKQIEFAPKAGTARASGDVIAQLASKQGSGPSADGTNIFPAGRPVFVNSDILVMTQAGKTAVFTGNVRAWQDTNTLLAQEMQVQGSGQMINARGNVRTFLYNAGSEMRKTPVQSRSDQLSGRRNDRRLDMAGNVRIEDETRTVTSEKAAFFFDEKRKLERVEAEEKVVLIEKVAQRKLTGDKAIYQVSKKLAYVSGKPATASDPKGSLNGEQILFDMNRNRVQVLSPTGKTEATYKQ